MSWRVAALALGILLAGAGAPAVVDAFGGGRGGYLAMAVFVALLLARRHARRGRRHPLRADADPGAERGPAGRQPASGLAVPAVPGAAHRLRDPGPGHRRHARRRAVLRASGCCRTAASRRCCSPPSSGRPSSSCRCGCGWAAGSASGSGLLIASALFVVAAAGLALGRPRPHRRSSSASWCWSASATPACRCSRCRCCPTRSRPTRRRRARGGPASSPASGRRPRRSASPSVPGCSAGCSRWPATCRGGAEVAAAGLRGHRRPARASASCPALLVLRQPARARPLPARRPRRRRVTPAGRARRADATCRPATCPTHGGATMAYVYDSGPLRHRPAGRRRAGRVPVDQRASTRPPSPASRASRTTWSAPRWHCSAADRTPSAR